MTDFIPSPLPKPAVSPNEVGILRTEEATPVQLTRMEGILNLIAERGQNTDRRVDEHARQLSTVFTNIGELQSETQTLKEGAIADEKKKIALALALKEADETRRTKSEQTWTPFQRLIVIISGIAGIVSIMLAVGANIN